MPPEPPRRSRRPLLLAVLAALLLLGGIVGAVGMLDGDKAVTVPVAESSPAPTPTPTPEPERPAPWADPAPPSVVLPSEFPSLAPPAKPAKPPKSSPKSSATASPEPSATPSRPGSPTTTRRPVTVVLPPLSDSLLAPGDLGLAAPGTWGVQSERLSPVSGRPFALFSCATPTQTVLPPFLSRVLRVPTAGGWSAEGPFVSQRLLRVGQGQGSGLVEAIRSTVRTCPERPVAGYTERWSVVQDERTANGDVLVLSHGALTQPRGFTVYGRHLLVVRVGDVLSVTDVGDGNGHASLAYTRQILEALRGRMCTAGGC